MRTGVYKIVCVPTGACYVGSAAVSFAKRFAQHRHELRTGKHKSTYMQRAWNKYGEAAFEFLVVERVSPERAVEREQVWLDNLQPKFNTAKQAGSNLGIKRTEKQRQELSERMRRQNQAKPDRGVGHLTALVKTDEFRAQASARMRRLHAEGVYRESQMQGGLRRSHKHSICGELLTLQEAAVKYGRTVKALQRRVERGFRGDAIVAPPRSRGGL